MGSVIEQRMLAGAASVFTDIVRSVEPALLGAKTPCEEYDVRALLNHLLYWGPWLEAAIRKHPAPAVEGGERDVDLVTGNWAVRFEKQVDGLLDASAQPGAFEGTTSMGGGELPASMVAEMVLTEWVVHGWDLARALGRPFTCDEAAIDGTEALRASVPSMAALGREMGIFGPEVFVPETAPALDRVLGHLGRDPMW
ncbi:MAG TPA: TIGR03086 family metal-binding protein [Amycolatopsis sp.]|uniref:TIGR03086 family metal-binding protein n=1 Tax=Amycolatopsis sp. TaxID=37632 RepID=UPI002B46AE7F|nr:TIGR03086 family metal-binding protein [Amycolatopsis sp.]HKS48473.1 TIGR03086 family metal-binding protein [Amycolatopsis sp.]